MIKFGNVCVPELVIVISTIHFLLFIYELPTYASSV